jgi:hypothetical protein
MGDGVGAAPDHRGWQSVDVAGADVVADSNPISNAETNLGRWQVEQPLCLDAGADSVVAEMGCSLSSSPAVTRATRVSMALGGSGGWLWVWGRPGVKRRPRSGEFGGGGERYGHRADGLALTGLPWDLAKAPQQDAGLDTVSPGCQARPARSPSLQRRSAARLRGAHRGVGDLRVPARCAVGPQRGPPAPEDLVAPSR